MTPTFPESVLAHFSAADLENERALRRAYSKLIKTFTPQSHPAEFQQIREAYEQARAILKGGPAPMPRARAAEADAPTAPGAAPAPAPAPGTPDDEHAVPVHPKVAAAIAEATAPELEQLLVSLTTEALGGDASAVYAGLGVVEALAPKQRLSWLLRVRDGGAPHPAICGALQALLEVMPQAAATDGMDDFVASLSNTPGGIELVLDWLNACIISEKAEQALAGLERFELLIMKQSMDLWAEMACALVADVGWWLEPDALRGLLVKLEDHQLRISESKQTSLEQLALSAISYRAFVRDPVVPVGLHEPIRRGSYAPRVIAFAALRDIVGTMRNTPIHGAAPHALVHAHYGYIESYHPDVLKLLRDMEGLVTGRDAFIAAWHNNGTVNPSVELNSAAMALNAAVLDIHQPIQRHESPLALVPTKHPMSGTNMALLLPSLYVIAAVVGIAPFSPLITIAAVAAGGFGLSRHFAEKKAAQASARALPAPTSGAQAPGKTKRAALPSDPRERLLSLQRAFGLWSHELAYAAQVYELDVVRLFPDPILLEPTLDLEGLSDMHLKRVMYESTQAPTAQREGAP